MASSVGGLDDRGTAECEVELEIRVMAVPPITNGTVTDAPNVASADQPAARLHQPELAVGELGSEAFGPGALVVAHQNAVKHGTLACEPSRQPTVARRGSGRSASHSPSERPTSSFMISLVPP